MSFISSPADVSAEFYSDVAQRLVFSDEYPGILDVGFIAPSTSPVNQSIQYSRYYHPNANVINREAWSAALTISDWSSISGFSRGVYVAMP